MIFAEYKKELLVAVIMIGSFIYFYLSRYKDSLKEVFDVSYLKRLSLLSREAVSLSSQYPPFLK
jgi:hypothetical protein